MHHTLLRIVVMLMLSGVVAEIPANQLPGDGPIEATSLAGQPLRRPDMPAARREKLESSLAAAMARLEREPDHVDAHIWKGRRLAYLWRYQESIRVYTAAMERFPDEPRLYRHRGHRYITTRQFAKAIGDLETAARLITGTDDRVEEDGAPNAAGIPTSSLHTNIWYHLGLAYYLEERYDKALEAYGQCMAAATNDDMRVATWDWMAMTLRRLGRHEEARKLIAPVTADMKLLENFSYHRRLLMYQGKLEPESLLAAEGENRDLELATQGYGVAQWYLSTGREAEGVKILRQVVAGSYWSAFGFIAAEADLQRIE